MERKRILIADDEPQTAEALAKYFRREGMIVETSGTVADTLRALESFAPDILVLDVRLPDGSGFDVLRTTAKLGGCAPAILLTAGVDEADRIVGAQLGEDNYVTKPFSPREVATRVRSMMRRAAESGAGRPAKKRRTSRVGGLELDHDFREATVDGTRVKLTATEFDILAALAERPGEVFTRSKMLDRLGDDGEVYERTLDRHINNLRKKIERCPHDPEYLLTVHGVGYKMRKL
jgi:two-component system, OmpR family, response regulator